VAGGGAVILLDTCTLLWLTSDPEALSGRAREVLRRHRGALFVSAISAFEIGQKASRQKLTLPMPNSQWYPSALRLHGLRECPVGGEVATRAPDLPDLHRDPFDRILIATALTHDWKLLTPDPLIHQYSDVEVVW
jgi:PIN domain nuclease of toxin-antitoxin system